MRPLWYSTTDTHREARGGGGHREHVHLRHPGAVRGEQGLDLVRGRVRVRVVRVRGKVGGRVRVRVGVGSGARLGP